MSDIVNHFNGLDDPRTGNACRHTFCDRIAISLLCALCGGETAVDMADFAQSKEDFLREFLELPGGLPCHDTFSRLFRLMKPSAFEAFFAKFRTDFAADRDAQNTPSAIAIDGSPSTRKVGTTFRIS